MTLQSKAFTPARLKKANFEENIFFINFDQIQNFFRCFKTIKSDFD
jgi:hypothetical protein